MQTDSTSLAPGLGARRRPGTLQAVRILGLDVGTKTIGVAISDELGIAGHALTTIARRNLRLDVEALVRLVRERQVTEIVVGLPLELSGEAGARARRVRHLVAVLGEQLGAAVPIHEWDERFSTAAVERTLLEADLSRRRRRQVVDKQAAAFILQGWLDASRQAQERQ